MENAMASILASSHRTETQWTGIGKNSAIKLWFVIPILDFFLLFTFEAISKIYPLQIGTVFGFLCTLQEQSSILPTIEWWIRKVTFANIVLFIWKNLLVKKCRSVHSQISISRVMIFFKIFFSKNLILNKNCFQKKIHTLLFCQKSKLKTTVLVLLNYISAFHHALVHT